MKQPPAFQFYARDWLAGDARPMSLEEKGAFIDLLAFAWLDEGIPDDPRRIAKILGVSPRDFAKIWPAIEPCWEPLQGTTKLVNRKLEDYRAELTAHRQERSESGRKGAEKRWNPDG